MNRENRSKKRREEDAAESPQRATLLGLVSRSWFELAFQAVPARCPRVSPPPPPIARPSSDVHFVPRVIAPLYSLIHPHFPGSNRVRSSIRVSLSLFLLPSSLFLPIFLFLYSSLGLACRTRRSRSDFQKVPVVTAPSPARFYQDFINLTRLCIIESLGGRESAARR